MAIFRDKRVAAERELSLYASGEQPYGSNPGFFITGSISDITQPNRKRTKSVNQTATVTNMR